MKLTPDAELVARERYYAEGEDWDQMCRRVSGAIAQAEQIGLREKYSAEFLFFIRNQFFMPGGRILRNAGFARNLINCVSIPIEDSIEEIGECIKNSLIVSASGGGLGTDYSTIRPSGMLIHGKGGEASGVLGWMEIINTANGVIETGGQRRGALLSVLNVDHPEIEEYLTAKHIDGRLSNFNLSVGVTGKFLDAVQKDLDWDLKFQGKVFKTI
jgi:ribonucleoside-diphosphate reductase alpha chain